MSSCITFEVSWIVVDRGVPSVWRTSEIRAGIILGGINCPNRGASRYLLRREEVVPNYRTRCAITRCREIMTPQLSIVKTRFAKASLRPRCARHRSWRATCRLPNRRAGTLSFPMVALDTQLPNSRDGSSGRSTTGGEFAQTWFTWSCARASSNGFVQLGTDGCQRSSVRERYR